MDSITMSNEIEDFILFENERDQFAKEDIRDPVVNSEHSSLIEELAKNITTSDFFTKTLNWNDSLITIEFNNTIAPNFDLTLYLSYAKWIFASYLGHDVTEIGLEDAMAYVLAQARNFQTDKLLFTFNQTSNKVKFIIPNLPKGVTDITLQINNPPHIPHEDEKHETENPKLSTDISDMKCDIGKDYVENLNKLFTTLENQIYENSKLEDLDSDSTEAYLHINNNILYLILLMFRRSFKAAQDLRTALLRGKTHETYRILCARRLGMHLPVISERLNQCLQMLFSTNKSGGQMIRLLVIKAYHGFVTEATGSLTEQGQGIMKPIWDATCMKHVKGTGLKLLTSFLYVSECYGLEASRLLNYLSYDITAESIRRIARVLIKNRGKMLNPPEEYKMFLWCRLFNQNYHEDLSHRSNAVLCYALAIMIDKKKGFARSAARNAAWTNGINENDKKLGEAIGTAVSDILAKLPQRWHQLAPSLDEYLKADDE